MLLDADLAAFYGVTAKRFNEQVKRNLARFPEDFMFQLNEIEFANLRSQFALSSLKGVSTVGRRDTPQAIIEPGAIMAAMVLNSARATEISVHVMRAVHRTAQYGLVPKAFNQQVRRNLGRFQTDFMFQLNDAESIALRSQFATLKVSRGLQVCSFIKF